MFGMIPVAAAVIPAVVLLIKVYKADRLEREPVGLIVSLVIMGIISTTVAGFLESVGISVLGRFFTEGSLIYNAVLYFGIVAFAEEGAKYVLLKKRTWNSQHFNCSFDGVVYSVSVSLGFALWENIGYVMQYGFSTAVVRAFTAVPGHACFGVFMGVWYGAAKLWNNRGEMLKSNYCRKKALLIPAIMHGAYDFLTTLKGSHGSFIWLGFVVILFILAYNRVRISSKNDEYINYNKFESFFTN